MASAKGALSVKKRSPFGPEVICETSAFGGNPLENVAITSVRGLILPMALPLCSTNQRLPSEPVVIAVGETVVGKGETRYGCHAFTLERPPGRPVAFAHRLRLRDPKEVAAGRGKRDRSEMCMLSSLAAWPRWAFVRDDTGDHALNSFMFAKFSM